MDYESFKFRFDYLKNQKECFDSTMKHIKLSDKKRKGVHPAMNKSVNKYHELVAGIQIREGRKLSKEEKKAVWNHEYEIK